MYGQPMIADDRRERGRAAYAQAAWLDAYHALSDADRTTPLAAADLQLLAVSAYMLARYDEYVALMERVHRLLLDAGATPAAVRTAFYIGMHLMLGGEPAQGTGWLGRAQRLLEREPAECVERGYLLMVPAFQREAMGDFDGAAATAGEAVALAERFDDRDLFALAMHTQGHFLVRGGRIVDGLRMLDEAMVAVTTGEVTPIPSGIVYCGVILACQAAREPRRAREWTAALTRWCERQPDLVAFSGRCHVHRAEIMQLEGAWSDALEEARTAARRAARGSHRRALAEAAYVQGEVHRLRGEAAEAEASYREANRNGRDPYPGLALLRLAQGAVDGAAAAMRRALGEAVAPSDRANLLPAAVEVLLAAGGTDEARAACEELAGIAGNDPVGVLPAIVAQTRGAVALAAGDARAALTMLRQAWRVWEDVEAPYEAARARELMGRACRVLGDEESSALELEAARAAFVALGAAPDVARLDALLGAAQVNDHAGLTAREREVLRLLAAGLSNKAIAGRLVLSERTIDRHASNIFAKLGVSSRAAATAYAYEHRLI
jgi:DNA-binding CsgD family transcriptional regulator